MDAHKYVNTHAYAKGEGHPGFIIGTLRFVDMENEDDCIFPHCCFVGMRGNQILTRFIWVT